MPSGRTILAILVAVAVALLPASGGAAFAAEHDGTHSRAAVALTMADADDAVPCDHGRSTVADCGSLAFCALKCFTYAGLSVPTIATPFAVACAPPVPPIDGVDSRDGAPPCRPPRA